MKLCTLLLSSEGVRLLCTTHSCVPVLVCRSGAVGAGGEAVCGAETVETVQAAQAVEGVQVLEVSNPQQQAVGRQVRAQQAAVPAEPGVPEAAAAVSRAVP